MSEGYVRFPEGLAGLYRKIRECQRSMSVFPKGWILDLGSKDFPAFRLTGVQDVRGSSWGGCTHGPDQAPSPFCSPSCV